MTEFPAPHPPFIEAAHHGGDQRPRMIVMHSTVSPCQLGGARAIARYFRDTETVASAHYTVDPGEVIQCVRDHKVAYHCGFNQDSLGIEMCEFPSMVNLARWSTTPHKQMFKRAVHLVARLCLAYNIAPHYVGVRKLRDGQHGITTHAAMSRAFKRSTHWDPGVWPRRRFLRAVRAEIARIKRAAA